MRHTLFRSGIATIGLSREREIAEAVTNSDVALENVESVLGRQLHRVRGVVVRDLAMVQISADG